MNITELAEKSGLTFDGGEDTRLFYDDNDRIYVHAPTIGETSYREMETKLDRVIDREKYCVYAWNDCSGFEYWNSPLELNYVQVTVEVKNSDMSDVEIDQMLLDCEDIKEDFYEYHSIKGYLSELGKAV